MLRNSLQNKVVVNRPQHVRNVADAVINRKRDSKCLRLSISASAATAAADGGGTATPSVTSFVEAFWKFLRPHTIRGTILGATAVTARALLESPQLVDWALLPKAIMGVLALLCGNGYIVGINQIYDVDIDIVNKPFLPIAAGEMSIGVAWASIIALAVMGLGIVTMNFGPLISGLYTFGLLLGTVYSIPPLRLKRFAVPAFLIIATVRGFLLNFGVYYATRAALGGSFEWSPAIMFITVFVTVFATVIAITKDLPDVDGDKANGIETFATRMGVKNVSLISAGLLMSNYVGAVVLALQQGSSFNFPVMVGAHSVLAALLLFRTWKLDQAKYTKEAIMSFYRWIWNLFYSTYAIFPFI
ncbi:hypothetical protein CEUSTIGMA_g1056.t1 [Chlamydomonas eustigma]|uniref:Homogentisate phytyltransferase n=1 Tax=Chlamydomonas eustigma TaxID=1157962 RepID=A0A250WRY9_9CHLO|nr:hypothetical protein CEUSTIGMA_g1056.t1 [Chlamydomonas eustigma]|eukprot:GAX73605.1 hypothetical protein CEUSTIGMA_g1056.t1 [Chlamydomonas eustigma]